MNQNKSIKNNDTLKEPTIISTISAVAIQCENRLWTYATILELGKANHSSWSYTIWVSRTGCILIRNVRHVKKTPITAEQQRPVYEKQ